MTLCEKESNVAKALLRAWSSVLIPALADWLANPPPAQKDGSPNPLDLCFKKLLGGLLHIHGFEGNEEKLKKLENDALKILQDAAKKTDFDGAANLNRWFEEQGGEEGWEALVSIKDLACIANQLECPRFKQLVANWPYLLGAFIGIVAKLGAKLGAIL